MNARAPKKKQARGARRQPQPRDLKLGLWLTRMALASVVVAVVYGGHYLLERVQQVPVERVMFAGEIEQADRQSLIDRVEPHLRQGYWSVKIRTIQRDLQQDPWVFRAVVERVWPAQLKITIAEQTPIAYWGELGLLNHRGEVFSPAELPLDLKLPVLNGPEGSAGRVMREYQLLNQALTDTPLQLEHLQVDARGSWKGVLGGDVELLLGRDPQYHMKRFLMVYHRVLSEHFEQVARIDTRYTNGLAVGWRNDKGSS